MGIKRPSDSQRSSVNNSPKYQIDAKECKHDDTVSHNAGGVANLVQQKKPFVNQSREREREKEQVWADGWYMYRHANNLCLHTAHRLSWLLITWLMTLKVLKSHESSDK